MDAGSYALLSNNLFFLSFSFGLGKRHPALEVLVFLCLASVCVCVYVSLAFFV